MPLWQFKQWQRTRWLKPFFWSLSGFCSSLDTQLVGTISQCCFLAVRYLQSNLDFAGDSPYIKKLKNMLRKDKQWVGAMSEIDSFAQEIRNAPSWRNVMKEWHGPHVGEEVTFPFMETFFFHLID